MCSHLDKTNLPVYHCLYRQSLVSPGFDRGHQPSLYTIPCQNSIYDLATVDDYALEKGNDYYQKTTGYLVQAEAMRLLPLLSFLRLR